MKQTILIVLLFVSACVAAKGRDSVIKPINKNEPNGKTKFFISSETRDELLDDILNNPDPRTVDDIHVTSQNISDVRRIFEVYGKEATTVDFGNWYGHQYNTQDVLDALNLLPNVENLEFTWHKEEFLGDVVGSLNMPKLKKLTLVDNSGKDKKILLNFLTKVLPENKLTTLGLEDDENYGEFLSKQRNIKELKFYGENPKFDEAFNDLKLEKLSISVHSNDHEKDPIRQKFVKALIESQPNVKSLQLFETSYYAYELIDDEILEQVTKLSNLESLKLGVDGLISLNGLDNLKNLKELELKTDIKENFPLFEQFSSFKFDKLEKLTLHLGTLDLSDETYQKMSKNLPNLKSLRITLGVRHTINFYAKTFPQIEELSIRFGEANNHFQFGAAYDKNAKDVQRNLKKINFLFQGNEVVNADDFVGMLNLFPNLESVEVKSKFPFTADFFTKLKDNVNNLKVLKLSSYPIDSYEEFPAATSDAVKALAPKLKFVKLSFSNERKRFDKNYNQNFNYQPFVDAIKDVYSYEEGGMRTLNSYKTLSLEKGSED